MQVRICRQFGRLSKRGQVCVLCLRQQAPAETKLDSVGLLSVEQRHHQNSCLRQLDRKRNMESKKESPRRCFRRQNAGMSLRLTCVVTHFASNPYTLNSQILSRNFAVDGMMCKGCRSSDTATVQFSKIEAPAHPRLSPKNISQAGCFMWSGFSFPR